MNDKIRKVFYWISTIVMCTIFLFSATMYFAKTELIMHYFETLHYPSYLVYPLAIAKILGVIAVLSNVSKVLKEWAYAGFFINSILAATAHIIENDNGEAMSIIALISVVVSQYCWSRDYADQISKLFRGELISLIAVVLILIIRVFWIMLN